jgi:SAM-dependent methyltransferase
MTTCPACSGRDWIEWREVEDRFSSTSRYQIERCAVCGLGRTVGSDDGAQATAYAAAFERPSTGPVGTARRLYRWWLLRPRVSAVASAVGSGRILDVGCGTGELAAALTQAGFEVEGVEPEEDAAERARFRGVNVFGRSIEELPQEPRYDGVVMWHVIEHLPDPLSTLQLLKKRLAPGGVVVAAAPNVDSFDCSVWKKLWTHWDVPRHRWHFGRRSIRLLAGRAGFDVVVHRGTTQETWAGAVASTRRCFGASFHSLWRLLVLPFSFLGRAPGQLVVLKART